LDSGISPLLDRPKNIMTDLNSRPYNPSPEKCCEACIFGTGEHAEWCKVPAWAKVTGEQARKILELRAPLA